MPVNKTIKRIFSHIWEGKRTLRMLKRISEVQFGTGSGLIEKYF
jgi:hypothetical protein